MATFNKDLDNFTLEGFSKTIQHKLLRKGGLGNGSLGVNAVTASFLRSSQPSVAPEEDTLPMLETFEDWDFS